MTGDETIVIPRIIHYCWFGSTPIPSNDKQYIHQWGKICPSFKFMKWSENNFNCNQHLFAKIAYQTKSWAAVSDYVRLYALLKYGGIYLDTDVKLLKSLVPLLKNKAFIGMETPKAITDGLIFGAKPHSKIVANLLKIYNHLGLQSNVKENLNDQVYIMTAYFISLGVKLVNKKQLIGGCKIYPTDYFCPIRIDNGLKKHLTKNTYSIHTYDNSWQSSTNNEREAIFERDFPSKIKYYLHIIKQLNL